MTTFLNGNSFQIYLNILTDDIDAAVRELKLFYTDKHANIKVEENLYNLNLSMGNYISKVIGSNTNLSNPINCYSGSASRSYFNIIDN